MLNTTRRHQNRMVAGKSFSHASLLSLLEDPAVCQVAYFDDQRKVISSEAGRFNPRIAVLVQTHNGDAMAIATPRLILPNACLNQAKTNRVNGMF